MLMNTQLNDNMTLLDNLCGDYRNHLERLEQRLDLLGPQDRRLLESYICHGVGFRQLEQLTGQRARPLSRRIHNLCQGLLANQYLTVVRHADVFSPQTTSLAYDYFLCRRGYRSLARRYRLSEWQARKRIAQLEATVATLNENHSTRKETRS